MGRVAEIERVRRKVRDSVAARRVEVAFIAGERGIGKSSLASFVLSLGEREHATLGIHAMLGGAETVEGAVKRVFDQLIKEHSDGTVFDAIKGLFGKHVRKVGLFGITVEFDASDRELGRLADSFSTALRNLLDKVPDRKGLILVLDDINGLAGCERFANWFKSLVDEISLSRNPIPLCILLVGLDERRHALIACQPSLARVFDPVEIRVWSDAESRSFFSETFERSGIACTDDALDLMIRYAGGLPVLAHEIGDAVFTINTDASVDKNDALSGVFVAADRVGSRYLDPMVYNSMRSQRYRAILRRMARRPAHQEFTRSEIRASLPEEEKRVFDNFLSKMKKLRVVIEDPEGGRGAYKFSTSLHYLYFFLEAIRAEKVDS